MRKQQVLHSLLLVTLTINLWLTSVVSSTGVSHETNYDEEQGAKNSKVVEGEMKYLQLTKKQIGPELIRDNGFPFETHNVTSSDGYITTLIRIPYGQNSSKSSAGQRKVVLFHHGYAMDGFSWILNTVDKALPYRLANLGNYDVWLINNRGTYYSLDHTRLSYRQSAYWNFSLHEIGIQDVPLIIDYVLNISGQKDLYYVGHSMGNSALMVALSYFPEYNSKIRTLISLAPALLVGNTSAPFEPFVPAVLKFQDVFDDDHSKPVMSTSTVTTIGNLCATGIIAKWICYAVLENFFGYDIPEINYDASVEVIQHGLATASIKGLFHILQLWTSGNFQHYDYLKRNNEVYGQDYPPKYDLSKVTIPVILFCGLHDNLVTCTDIQKLEHILPNIKEFNVVGWRKFNHIDFLFAKDINPLMNDRIVDIIDQDIFIEK